MGLLDFIAGSADPSTVDPQTGLTENQRRQSFYGGLTQIGASLLAAGQPMDPSQRAPYLSQLGLVPQQMQAQQQGMSELQTRYAQQKLLQQKAAEAKTEAEMIRSPEFQAALAKLPPEMQALAKVSPSAAIAAVKDHAMQQRAEALQIGQDKRLDKREADAFARQTAMFGQQQAIQDAREAARQKLEEGKDKSLGPDVVKIGGKLYRFNPWTGKPEPLDLPGAPAPALPPAASADNGMPSAMPQLGIPPAALSLPQQQLTAPPSPASVAPPNAAGQGAGEGVDPSQPGPVQQTLNTEMLGQLSPEEGRVIHGIATYQTEPPRGAGARGIAAKQRVMSKVLEYNPDYNEGRYKRIQDALKEMGPNGVTGRGLIAVDTAYGHLGQLYDVASKMKNGNLQAQNELVNYVQEKLGHSDVTNFEQAKMVVGSEIAKAVHGAGVVSQEQTAHWQKVFSRAQSPKQMQDGIEQAMEAMEKRVEAAKFGFERTTDKEYGKPLINPKNLAKAEFIKNNRLDAKVVKGAPAAVTGRAPVPDTGEKPVRKYNVQTGRFE